jgi:hypothetical protein
VSQLLVCPESGLYQSAESLHAMQQLEQSA